MPKKNRETLKEHFKQGSRPSESDFTNLIDSTLNILDDGFYRNANTGIELSPLYENGVVLTVFNDQEHEIPQWEIAINRDSNDLSIQRVQQGKAIPAILLKSDGAIVLGNSDKDILLRGNLHTSGRTGTFSEGWINADGKWHDITDYLEGMWALEVVAGCGKAYTGKHAILLATATHCYGSRAKIKKIRSFFGVFGNKISIRWKKSDLKAKLQLRTVFNYGEEVKIRYHVGKLWNDQINFISPND
ncbi:MAG: hypothetical protein RR034_05635 [Bacteroidales bacterium]